MGGSSEPAEVNAGADRTTAAISNESKIDKLYIIPLLKKRGYKEKCSEIRAY